MMKQFFRQNIVSNFYEKCKKYLDNDYIFSNIHLILCFLCSAHGFPSSFETIVRKILRLLFHVLAHLYHSHFREMVMLNLHSHLNSVFSHLIILNDCYHLIDDRELDILFDLVNALKILDVSGPVVKPADAIAQDSVTNGLILIEDSTILSTDRKQVS